MKFIYPDFLIALALIAIPIIIHLFNFRRFKKIDFTNVKFLKELKEETNSRSKIKHLLVLLSRIGAVAALVFAFAQPYIPVANSSDVQDKRFVNVYIDNSFSMEALSEDGNLLNEAKKKAAEIVSAYQASDQFQLLTNDFEASHSRAVNRDDFLDLLDEISPSPAVKSVAKIIGRQTDALKNAGEGTYVSYLLSDFQKSTSDLAFIKSDTSVSYNFIPLESQARNNLYIDSVWLSSPVIQLNQSAELKILMRNTGDEAVENVPLKLTINGVQKALTSVNIDAQQSVQTLLNFTIGQPGWQSAELVINDYPITFDDKYFFSFKVSPNINVLSINNEATEKHTSALFGGDEYFKLNNLSVNRIDYSKFSENDLIMVNGLRSVSSGLASELIKALENGKSVCIIPPDTNINLKLWEQFLTALEISPYNEVLKISDKIDKINLTHEIYSGVFERVPRNIDLPVVKKYYGQVVNTRSLSENILSLSDGTPVLTENKVKKGRIYLFNLPLSSTFSNITSHAIFVPTIYRMALISSRNDQPLSYVVGKLNSVQVDQLGAGGEEVFHLTSTDNAFDIIPEHRPSSTGLKIIFSDQIKNAGNYKLTAREDVVSVVAMNYDTRESDLSTLDADALTEQLQNARLANVAVIGQNDVGLTKKLQQMNEGIQLWKYLIILALLFLLAEVLLLKFLK